MPGGKKSVRFVGARIEFDLMVDDGESLLPVVVSNESGEAGNPLKVITGLAEWKDFCADGLPIILASLEEQLQAQERAAESDEA